MNIPTIAKFRFVDAEPVGSAKQHRELARAARRLAEQNVFGADNVLDVTFDQASHRPVLRIISRSTHELVAQLPAEAVLRLLEQLGPQS